MQYSDDLLIAFCGNPLDRAEDRRGDEDWLAAALHRGRILPVAGGKVLMETSERLAPGWRRHDDIHEALEADGDVVFLGLDIDQTPCFAATVKDDLERPGCKLIDGRSAAMQLSDPARDRGTSGIIAQTLSILAWHRRHRFCAKCGAATSVRRGGYQRWCAACETEHFPRTDPVAIMLVSAGERCLLGRQAQFPPNVWSALAGFVEAGESLEAAVRREVHEEAGIEVGRVRYIGSQPWPFPSNLMLGFIAEAVSETITVDKAELEDARWFSREDVAAAFRGQSDQLIAPPPIAIAHHLMKIWLSAS